MRTVHSLVSLAQALGAQHELQWGVFYGEMQSIEDLRVQRCSFENMAGFR